MFFWIFVLIIIGCSIIGFVTNEKKDKKELSNILEAKKIRDKQVICFKEEEEQDIEQIYYFNDEGKILDEYDTNIYSSVSDTSAEYKKLVEEHFKDLFCKDDALECNYKWNGKKIKVIIKSKILSEYDGVDKDTLKTKMRKLDSEFKCK